VRGERYCKIFTEWERGQGELQIVERCLGLRTERGLGRWKRKLVILTVILRVV